MGNYVSPHCVLCDKPLKFEASCSPLAAYRSCTWCHSFALNFNKNICVQKSYYPHEYSFLDFMGVKNAFVGTTCCITPGYGHVNLFGRLQSSSEEKDIGGFYSEEGIHSFAGILAFRHDYAVKQEWNTCTTAIALAIPPNIEYYSGISAPQGIYRGGRRQIYIHPEVAKALYPASCKFLLKPGPEAYEQFLKDSAPALAIQVRLQQEFGAAKKSVDNDAYDSNTIRKMNELLNEHLRQKTVHLLYDAVQLAKTVTMRLSKNNANFEEIKAKILVREMEWMRINESRSLKGAVVAEDFKMGNNYAHLKDKVRRILQSPVNSVQPLNDNNCPDSALGIHLVHKDKNVQVTVEIIYKGQEQRNNVTVYKYLILTTITEV